MKTIPTQLAKRLVVTCGLLAVITSAQAQFTTVPIYESFSEYPSGARIGKTDANSGPFWSVGNSLSTTSSPEVTNSAVLFYPGLLPDQSATPEGITGQTGVGRTTTAPFTPVTNGTVYMSILYNLQSLPTGGTGTRAVFGLYGGTSSTPSPTGGAAVWVNSLGQLQVSKTAASSTGPPATNTTIPLVLSNTYFIVLSYTFSTNPSPISLWLNPTSLGGAAPTPTFTTTNGGANATMINEIALFAPSGAPTISSSFIDEIRISTNWSDVTPPSCSPGPSFNITGGGTGCPGQTFDVSLSGSAATNEYLLFTNGVFSGEIVQGTGSAISFGQQSTSGSYVALATNTTSGCAGWMNGTVTIAVSAGPVITSEPSPALTANNGVAVFTAGVTGDNLVYQWYRNGAALSDASEFSGTKTTTLVVSPATSADAATSANGYYLIISNNCGLTAVTTTNALTIDTAANLTWVGNNPNSNWDLSTTANFNNGSGPAVFNSGDNVTFDDTAAEETVFLVGNFLTPGIMTVNTGGTYTFSGSGTIAGTASLYVIGGGTVAFSNFNTFSGGSFLASGTTSLRNSAFGALGTGPITMEGGTLDVLTSGSASQGISNNIVVTTNSTIEYDGTGSFGCVVFGTVTGTPGTTLEIYTAQEPSTASRVRFYNTNFTENGDVNLNSSFTQFAPCNPAGTQTYNGVISGGGSIIAKQGGGNIVLNNTNTFTGGTTLATGSTGFGIDTVTNSDGSIAAGPLGTDRINLALDSTPVQGSTANATVFAFGGPHTVANAVIYSNTLTAFTFILGGSNSLTLSGGFDLAGQDGTGGSNRVIQVENTNTLMTISGVISDDALICGIIKSGPGALVISANNTYDGPTVISNGTLFVDGSIDTNSVTVDAGTLGGSGTIKGAVTLAGGTLAPGDSGIGTLTIANSLTLLSGSTTSVEVNKGAGTHDLIAVQTALAYAGTLNASNISGTLDVGDSFTIFSAGSHSGNFTNITGSPGSGKAWSFNPTNGMLSVISGGAIVATNETNITFTATSTGITLKWPADHTGWRLQAQTNPVGAGISDNWFTVSGSTNTNSFVAPITTNGSVFYRMIYP